MLGERLADSGAGVEKRAPARGPLDGDGARHDVARRQFGRRMITGHEGLAGEIDQTRAVSAQSFGGQGRGVGAHVYGGGMKLDELRIDDARSDGGGQGQTLAAHGGRIGGDRIETAETAGRQDCGWSDDFQAAPVMVGQNAACAAPRVDKQRADAPAFEDFDMVGGAHGGDHRPHDRGASPVAADTCDAGARMRRLQALDEATIGSAIERGAQRGQGADGSRTLAREDIDGRRIAKAGPGRQGVGGMQGGIVVVTQRHGHAALRPGRRTSRAQRRGGEDEHRPWSGGQGGGKARKAGADDHDAVECHASGHGPVRSVRHRRGDAP